jgi:hypothetical protein
VSRTGRYRNDGIDYRFLDEFESLFLGLPVDFEAFGRKGPSAEYLPTANLHEAAGVIAGLSLFVRSQSVLFAIGEGLKVRLVLEVCPWAANVVPMGGECSDCVGQTAFEAVITEAMR